MCVQCLTPNKLPAPNQRAQRGEGFMSRSLLFLSWPSHGAKKITVSEVLGQFDGGAKNVPSSSSFQMNTFKKVAPRWDGTGCDASTWEVVGSQRQASVTVR